MSVGDVFLLVVRWLHLVSAVVWIGGSLFYLLVLRPALRKVPETPRFLTAVSEAEFRTLVNTCIVVLISTGVILAFNRLTVGVDAPYAVTLGVKSVLSVCMFLLVREQRSSNQVMDLYQEQHQPAATGLRKIGRMVSGYNALVILGIIVFLLSDLLKVLFEMALSRG